MRRLAAIAALLAVAAFLAAAGAGADSTHSYRIELYNAFGVVEGSDVRVAGVNAGSVTGVGITPEKRAVVTVELDGSLGTLGDRTRCSAEPQSLIAEYFIDCDPRGAPLPDDATIPASRVELTVQQDLLQDTFRAPFRERLRLLVNEFGAGAAGNAESLNEAIRLGFPALDRLERTTRVLVGQRRAIERFNADAATVLERLAGRRDDVSRAIVAARDTTSVAAARRAELGEAAGMLDDFAGELRPTLARLGEAARAGTPLLARLRTAAPALNEVAARFPGFAGSGGRALEALGEAAVPGRAALVQGGDEIRALRAAGLNAPTDAEILADLLRDLDDPGRAVEIDRRAARTCDRPSRPCYATGRPAPTGYTGLEALLTYVYHQTLAVNQFDSIGHILQFTVHDPGFAAGCSQFNAGPDVPAAGGGRTTDLLEADPCVSWVGPNQPDISFDLGLPRYDDSVCPDGSTDLDLCDPEISTDPGGAPEASPAPVLGCPGCGALLGGAADGSGDRAAPAGPASGGGILPAVTDALGEALPPRLRDRILPGTGEARDRRRGRDGHGPNGAARTLLDFLMGP